MFSSLEPEDGPSIDGLSTSPKASIGKSVLVCCSLQDFYLFFITEQHCNYLCDDKRTACQSRKFCVCATTSEHNYCCLKTKVNDVDNVTAGHFCFCGSDSHEYNSSPKPIQHQTFHQTESMKFTQLHTMILRLILKKKANFLRISVDNIFARSETKL